MPPPSRLPASDHRRQVLGVPRDADGNAVQRAYRKRMGEVKGKDEAAAQRIEAAHSQIMMAALTSRLKVPRRSKAGTGCLGAGQGGRRACLEGGLSVHLGAVPPPKLSGADAAPSCPSVSAAAAAPAQGNVSVEKDVLYADRAKFFPWRPRLWMAAYDILLYSALAQVRRRLLHTRFVAGQCGCMLMRAGVRLRRRGVFKWTGLWVRNACLDTARVAWASLTSSFSALCVSVCVQALMLAWALLSPLTAGTQPVIWCEWDGAGCGRGCRVAS